jgi:hypothetical protein
VTSPSPSGSIRGVLNSVRSLARAKARLTRLAHGVAQRAEMGCDRVLPNTGADGVADAVNVAVLIWLFGAKS